MKPEHKLKIQNILIITIIGLFFGLFYNYLFYEHTITEFAEAGSIGILLGVIVGVIEQFVLLRFFMKKTFLFVTFIRSALYAIITALVLSSVLSIEISFVENISYRDAWMEYLHSKFFIRDLLFTSALVLVMLLSLEIILLIGKLNFLRLIFGWYHQPSEVSRVFMFVDLKGSTSLAEKLSNKEYSAFIRDYFYDISDAIAMFGGEIYQYVGDEIVVVWKFKKDNSNCVKSFFKMKEIIEEKSKNYIRKFGFVPEFKAGIHSGKVIATQVGKIKKELVYHGDVLNTAARIEGQCNPLKESLLISENIKESLSSNNVFSIMEKGAIPLRGKKQSLILFAVSTNV
ncbi:adenylate/guanylate cyclase domain-containing protein [Flavobacteriaceae bacterium SZ-1-7]|uniref:adenylate/guanylate cyclase domain-containing protein n=1 Tax=Tamlana sedimenti TaxID=3134126 RepID=UPI003129C93F